VERSAKPFHFSQTVIPAAEPARTPRGLPGRPLKRLPGARPTDDAPEVLEEPRSQSPSEVARDQHPFEPLVREWLLELRVMGRSARTLRWYGQKMAFMAAAVELKSLEDMTGFRLKRFLAELQRRGLADNTVHGFFQVVHGFANWAAREGYPVDASLLRMRPPKVAQQEMATYSEDQVQAILKATQPDWARLAIPMLLGTGMRVSEMCALTLEDVEDDGEGMFLKIRKGKGAKFRRVPVSLRLRREIVHYVNRVRPDSGEPYLLLLSNGRAVRMTTAVALFARTKEKVGFPVHAHRFRHTFATEYLRRGGEIERLRRILGHTTYVMVMRYVHLDKGDLGRDFDLRSPF
jgi:integrase/recombinase XerD